MKEIMKLYNSLNTLELVLICLFIALFIFLVILSVLLVRKNKVLMNRISELEEANRIDDDEQLFEEHYQAENSLNIEENLEKKQDSTEIIREEIEDNNVNIYQKNILNDMVKQTSPISITSPSSDDNAKESYLESVSKSLEEHQDVDPIELTDYEQQQEDEAIISYQELLGSQDKLYNITDEEEDSPFIEELKSFRKSL